MKVQKLGILAGLGAAAACALAIPLLAQDDTKLERSGQAVIATTLGDKVKDLPAADKEKLEKELKDAEAQSEKASARVRDLRRKLGKPDVRVFTVPDFKWESAKGFDGAKSKEIEKAMEQAHKAMKEALKSNPHLKELMPEIHKGIAEGLRSGLQPHIFSFKGLDSLPNEERVRVFRDLETNKKEGADARAEILRVLPRLRSGEMDKELREELKQLRKELDELRKEIRKEKGGADKDDTVRL